VDRDGEVNHEKLPVALRMVPPALRAAPAVNDGAAPVARAAAAVEDGMTPAEHAVLPWHVGPHYKSDVESRLGRVCECHPMTSPFALANAAFIVRACNSHEELLAAARFALARLVSISDFSEPHSEASQLQCVLRAAIAKAEAP
jgi:hypothetical protein